MNRPYWKPEPRLWDFVSILLLASAAASAVGYIPNILCHYNGNTLHAEVDV